MRADVRLVQGRDVDDGLDAVEGPPHDRAVRDRADHVGLRRVEDVEADDLLAGVGQDANERVAEVARAAGHEDAHRRRGSRRPPEAELRPSYGPTRAR